MTGEMLDIVDENDWVVGRADRRDVHGNPSLLHRVVHVLLFNSKGQLFLQKRADHKRVGPGKWDTSVGGHVNAGEGRDDAVRRELAEELGIPGPTETECRLLFLHRYRHRNAWESELVFTWICRWDGPIRVQESEISQGRFWDLSEIDRLRRGGSGASLFTPNFLDELDRWRATGATPP